MKFRRRLVALAQAQQQRQQNPQIIINTESRSLEDRRQPGNSGQIGQQTISLQVASKSSQKESTQFNQIVGTAREVQSKPQDRLIMIMQKNEGMINSVRDGASNQQAIVNSQKNEQQLRRNDSKIMNSQEGKNMIKNIMTISSNEGSASRSINNQQQNYHNQLSNSLQIDGSRRIAAQKTKMSQQHLSGSAETANRFANSQKQLVNSSQLSNQAVASRRRQHNMANKNCDPNQIQIENNFGIENFHTRGAAYGKLLQNNTTGSQLLKQEIQDINKGLREAQKSQTILMPGGISNQKSMSQIQNRLSTDNKSSVTRKPSRGNQKNMKNTIVDKNQGPQNKLIFSTPALITDSSQTSLPNQNVIFHPHPLNGNVQNNENKSLEGAINKGNCGYMSTQNNQIVFNATTAIGNTSQTIAVNSARPQSQKMTIPIQQSNQQTINNRNSRKNLRPIGKKNNQNSQSNFKTKTKNPSREQYVTSNDQFASLKPKMPNQNQMTQNVKGFQSLQHQNPTLNIQQIQQEMSYSSSRERAILIGNINFNSQKQPQYSINQQTSKIAPKDLVYSQNIVQVQQPQHASNQMTNITNKNTLFKFKKSGNNIKNSSQLQLMDGQGNIQTISDLNLLNSQGQIGQNQNIAVFNSHKQSRRGTNGMQINNPGINLQKTQPLQFDNLNGNNQLLPGPNITSQRSHGPNIIIPGDIHVNNNGNSQHKIKIAATIGPAIQNKHPKNASNLIQNEVQPNKILRQRSIQEQHGYINDEKEVYQRAAASQLLNQQQDNLNQLSEIGIVEQLSKEESIINNPLLLLEPSQQTPVYPNIEGLASYPNEVSSFNEAPVGVGFSNLSEIEKLMAEGSQLSKIDSSEVQININALNKEQNQIDYCQNENFVQNKQNELCLDFKIDELNQQESRSNNQALKIVKSARQSSINTNKHGQININQPSTNEASLKKLYQEQQKSNNQGQQTTVLGSLTSNFPTTQQKKQIMPQKIIQGQSNSQQQIPTMQQINTLLATHNSINNVADSARASNMTTNGHLSSNKYATNVQQSTINSKLIKINKSKKMVDTARRSRIKQLDGYNSQNQETQASKANLNNEMFIAPESIKISQIQTNCAPSRQNQKQSSQIPVSATNSQSKSKQLFSGSQQNVHFNNTQQFVNPLASNQAQKLESLMNSQRKQQNPKVNSLGRNIVKKNIDALSDNNYQSSTNQKGMKLSQQPSRNELQLTMNINSSQTQINWAKQDKLTSQSNDNAQGYNMKNNLSVKQQKLLNNEKSKNTNSSDQRQQYVNLVNQQPDQVQQLPQIGKYQTCDTGEQGKRNQIQQENFSGQGNILEIGLQQQQQYQLSVKNTPQKSQMHLSSKINPNSIAQTQRSLKSTKQDVAQTNKSAREASVTKSAHKNIQQKIKLKDSSKTGSNTNQADVAKKDSDTNLIQSMQKMKMSSTLKKNTVQEESANKDQQPIFDKNNKQSDKMSQQLQEQIENAKLPQIYDVSSAQTSNQTSIILPTQQEIEEGKSSIEENQDQLVKQEYDEATQKQKIMQSEFIHVQNQQQSNQSSSKKAQRENIQEINDKNVVKPDYNLHVTQQNAQQVHQQQQVTIGSKAREQITTMDTNSNRKQTTSDSLQRTNFNTSMQNIPRGLINTAFSLSSVTSKDEIVIPALPTTPQNILRYYIHELTDFEKAEVLDYDIIYFLGKSRDKKVDQKKQKTAKGQTEEQNNPTKNQKAKSSCSEGAEKKDTEQGDKFIYNYGYDDEKGDYKVVVGDHIGYRYEIVEFLGKGSFGTALGCIDHKEKREVAVKIVKNKKKYYYQASVELKILQYLRQHDHEDIMNVIHIEDYVVFRKHLCMSFERLSMNLFEFLKINDFNGFDHNLIRRFAIQLLYALKYLKQLEIIHCDLKPENILLKEENKSGIKIIDFGSSTFIDEKVYTYIQSRFYRAPEIMLGIPYTPAIDMWSLGCIMAELYIGYPLFPGESENDQMSRIMEMRDVPPKDVLAISERKQKFFKDVNGTLEPIMLKNSKGKLRKPNGKPLDYVIGDEDADFNDFVIKCLDWNPQSRLTPDDALKHVWVLKGLPPQVLIHHQKMHNIQTPELPQSVKLARDEFLFEQQKEQELIMKQQQRKQRGQGKNDQGRDISYNPTAGRPHIQLKTPRHNPQQPQLTNLKVISTSNQKLLTSKQAIDQRSQDRLNYQTAYPSLKTTGAVGPVDQIPHLNSQRAQLQVADEITTPSAGNNGQLGRKRFVIKKTNGVEGAAQSGQINNRNKN